MKFLTVVFVAFVTISLTSSYPQWPSPDLTLPDQAQNLLKDNGNSDDTAAGSYAPVTSLENVMSGGSLTGLSALGKIPTDTSDVVGSNSGWSAFLQLLLGLFLKLFMRSLPGADVISGGANAVSGAIGGLTK